MDQDQLSACRLKAATPFFEAFAKVVIAPLVRNAPDRRGC
jgi:hypothetical protein